MRLSAILFRRAFFSLLILPAVTAILPGCYPAPVVLVPNTPQVPLLRKAGDMHLMVRGGTDGLGISASAAILDYAGLSFDGSWQSVDSTSAGQHAGHCYGEAALVLCDHDLFEGLEVELLGGYGKGYGVGRGYDKFAPMVGVVHSSIVSSDYQMGFGQINVGGLQEHDGKSLQYGGLLKLSNVWFSHYQWGETPGTDRSFFMLQPSLYMQLDWKLVSFQSVIGGVRLIGN